MGWPGGDHGYDGGQGAQNNGDWSGAPPPNGPGGYGGPPGFPPPPPPPSRSSAGAIVAVAVVVLVLLGGVAIAAVLLSGGHERRHTTMPSAHGLPGGSSAPSAPGRPGPSSTVMPSARPKVPGWQAVVAVQHGLTYDVPPTWSVRSPDTIVGFDDAHGKPAVAGSGAAIYKPGYCPGQSGSRRAESAVTEYTTLDLAGDARDAAKKWGTYGYTPGQGGSAPTVTLSAPRPVSAQGVASEEVTANVTVHAPGNPCAPPRAIVHAVATPLKNGKVSVLVVLADQGVPDAAPDTDLQKIIASVRRTNP